MDDSMIHDKIMDEKKGIVGLFRGISAPSLRRTNKKTPLYIDGCQRRVKENERVL